MKRLGYSIMKMKSPTISPFANSGMWSPQKEHEGRKKQDGQKGETGWSHPPLEALVLPPVSRACRTAPNQAQSLPFSESLPVRLR